VIVDAITFGGELDMLEGRLATKFDDVDFFAIVEGNLMYANQPKDYLFQENYDRFKKYEDKIVYKKIVSLGSNDAWANDYHQRAQLTGIVETICSSDDDLVIVCDTDEWYDSRQILEINDVNCFNMPKYHMSLHWYHKHEVTGIAGRWKFLKGKDLNVERWKRHNFRGMTGGHHFTSMGSLDYLVRKVRGFAHQELVHDGLDEELAHCWIHGHDIDRQGGQYFEEIEFDDSFPKWVTERKFPSEWYRKRPLDSNTNG
jgi:hypothetical protein